MSINWKKKLGSRKFWAFISAITTSVCVLANAGEDTTAEILGLIGAVGSAVIYVLAEAYVDGKTVKGAPAELVEDTVEAEYQNHMK
ncbi:hypothetical protein DCCM_0413 [Desulfocucumis palustris]|uniref:Holin n=1 Tax=Desulfocucumis palustris TaxID=1898651 RepID=A0A2L2X894_9FIRM|nr:hypothetical protein [Desulfocucumis palustris]GBF32222.1 hypothetical protein DCCM_0413 [Desulfocucumis palustris]